MVHTEWHLSIEPSHLLEAWNLSESFLDELTPLVQVTLEVARPRLLWEPLTVQETKADGICIDGLWLHSTVLATNLQKGQQAMGYLLTCGKELQALADEKDDPLERYWQDKLNEEVLYQCIPQMHALSRQAYGDLYPYSMSPGSVPDWSISGIGDLFTLLGNVEAQVGVTLTDSFLMLPVKSVCGLLFSSDLEYTNCRICPRECPNRQSPYDQSLAVGHYGLS